MWWEDLTPIFEWEESDTLEVARIALGYWLLTKIQFWALIRG